MYITFKNITNDSARKQVVIENLIEDGSSTAKLNLTSSVDSGEWIVSESTFLYHLV